MKKMIQLSIQSLIVMTILTGVIYPLIVTGLSQAFFAKPANGSLIEVNGKVVGSELLAQKFTKPIYFWPRPSAGDFATIPSGASNFGPTNQKLKDRVAQSMKDMAIDPESNNKPYDMLLTSGSGLDPHITPESAFYQVDRVAKARGIDSAKVAAVVTQFVEGPFLGVLGRTRVNVLKLNLALDQLAK